MKFLQRLKNIRKNQKRGDVYYNYFTKYLSAPITACVSYTFITPNIATSTMFLFGLFGAFLFSLGGSINYILGGTMYILLILADTVDGELARFRGTSSLFGDYLDRLAHYVTNTSLFIGIGISLYNEFNQIWVIYFTWISMICYLFDDISRDLLISCGLGLSNSRKNEKIKLSIVKDSKIRKIIYYTASNTAFFHLIIPISLIDYLFNSLNQFDLSHLYIFYFFIITIIKILFRIPIIISLKDR